MAVSIDRELDYLKKIVIRTPINPDSPDGGMHIFQIGTYLAEALRRVATSVDNLGTNVGADPTQTVPAPSSPQQLAVKSNGAGLVHAVVTDHNQIQRGIHYFLEYANEPSFLQPHVKHLGASRSSDPLNLPAMDDDGNPQKWYFRTYSQLPGGHPSKPINFGGETPTAVDPGGTQQMTLIPSTGSGTAPANGQSAGQGFGKTLHRDASSNIRIVKNA